MRTEKVMYETILAAAESNSAVRVVGLNGSRANASAARDKYQDYDIAFIVDDMLKFTASDEWLNIFGGRIIMQKPENMTLFLPSLGGWVSYLMLFEDGNRIDLMLVPIADLDKYLQSSSLTKILLDKDKRVNSITPSEKDYFVTEPNREMFDDCCNEFWWITTYVAKGLARHEILYANEHIAIIRKELIRMLSWKAGSENEFKISVGKCGKNLSKFVTLAEWQMLLGTFNMSSEDKCKLALLDIIKMFTVVSKRVSEKLGLVYPEYESKVMPYLSSVIKQE